MLSVTCCGLLLYILVTTHSCRHGTCSTIEKRLRQRYRGREHINLGHCFLTLWRHLMCLQVPLLGILPQVWICRSAEQWCEPVPQRAEGQGWQSLRLLLPARCAQTSVVSTQRYHLLNFPKLRWVDIVEGHPILKFGQCFSLLKESSWCTHVVNEPSHSPRLEARTFSWEVYVIMFALQSRKVSLLDSELNN